MFKIKTKYYLVLLTPEAMTLLADTKNKITKDESSENDPHLELTEIVILQFTVILLTMTISNIQEFYIYIFS